MTFTPRERRLSQQPQTTVDSRLRNVAVLCDSTETCVQALAHATDTARDHHARMTLIAIVTPPWPTAAMAGICPPCSERELVAEAALTAKRAAATLPPDLPCTTYARCGHVCRELAPVLAREQIDLLYVPSQSSCLGKLTQRWTIRRLQTRTSTEVVIFEPATAPQRPQSSLRYARPEERLSGRTGSATDTPAPVSWI